MDLKDLWKKFDDSDLSHSSIHHLMAIFELLETRGYARGVDVSKFLNITRGSAFTTLKNLQEKGYIAEDENKFYSLSEKGKQVVEQTLSKRAIFKDFFVSVLQLDDAVSEAEACKIEHLLSTRTAEQAARFLSFFMTKSKAATEFRRFLSEQFDACNAAESCEKCEVECLFKITPNENSE